MNLFIFKSKLNSKNCQNMLLLKYIIVSCELPNNWVLSESSTRYRFFTRIGYP